MATYRANITQNVEPAMANPAYLQRAAQLEASASEMRSSAAATLIKGAETAFKGYVEAEVDNVSDEVRSATTEFFERNEALGQQRSLEQRRMGIAGSIMGPLQADEEENVNSLLGSFDKEINRLRQASQGGMRMEEYMDRVNTATRKAIARFPGMADTIRQRVARASGIENIDRLEESRFIQRVFSDKPTEDKTAQTRLQMAQKDIEGAAKLGVFTQQELFDMWSSGDPRYDDFMKTYKESTATTFALNNIKTNVESAVVTSDFQATQLQPQFNAILDFSFANNAFLIAAADKQQTLSNTFQLMLKGDPASVDPAAFDTLVKLHNAEVATAVNQGLDNALASLNAFFNMPENRNISAAKKREMREELVAQADAYKSRYANKEGLIAMAGIMNTYKEKSDAEQRTLYNLSIQTQQAFQNSDLARNYWVGGAAREDVKRRHPEFFSVMQTLEQQFISSSGAIRDPLAAARKIGSIEAITLDAGKTGSVPTVPPNADANDVKAAHQIIYSNALSALQKSNVSETDINVVKSALSTATEIGANSSVLANDYKRFSTLISNLPETAQNDIKAQTSSSIQTSISSLQAIKTFIEGKYGVTLQLGVNDAGQISVVTPPPEVSLQNRPLVNMSPTTNVNRDTAAKEFMRQTKPILNNIVYGRAMLTQEQPMAVGREFATLLNTNQPYGGFFSGSAQPVQQPAATEAQPSGQATSMPAAGMKASMADVAAFASQEGLSIDDAENQLRARGVIIDD
jgi:hypothetical protein